MAGRRLRSRAVRGMLMVLALFAVAGCGDDADQTAAPTTTTGAATTTTTEDDMDTADTAPAPLVLTSPAFADGATIPDLHSCKGDDRSPELAWTDPPEGTVSFALVMDDPDAVPVAGKVWDHWVLWGLSGGARSLAAGVPADETLADGSTQGENSFGRIGYGGPCPPSGQTHEYVTVLYALDTEVEPAGPTKADLLAAMEGHVLAEATLRGFFTS